MGLTWWRVSTDYAVFGLGVQRGKVVEAPPIAAWTKGKPIKRVLSFYVNQRGAKVVELDV